MKKIKKIISILLFLGIVGGGFLGYRVFEMFMSSNIKMEKEKEDIYIKTGATFEDVLDIIRPYVKDIKSFEKVAINRGYSENVKAGHYVLERGMSNKDIVKTLRFENTPVRVSFNNQERLENLAGRVSEEIEADSISLLKAFTDERFLKENGLSRENALGMFIPNTYEFYWNTTAEDFRDRMVKEYYHFWDSNMRKEKAKALGLTQNEVISLASIVQKETVKVDERSRVAGVYLNRLKEDMPLQADPTVIYAYKLYNNDFDIVIKRVLNTHLEIPSPYNTYKNKGIPPGPIFMADISSIDAVLNAEKHDYIFFVADVSRFGYHKFSRSYEQHKINKAEYVSWLEKNNIK